MTDLANHRRAASPPLGPARDRIGPVVHTPSTILATAK